MYDGCVDLNMDGVINPCSECLEIREEGCLESWVLLQNLNGENAEPYLFQTLQFPVDSIEFEGRVCSLTRSFTLSSLRRSESLVLSQNSQELRWNSGGIDAENTTLESLEFDGASRFLLSISGLEEEETLEIIAPAQQSATAVRNTEQCAAAFVPDNERPQIDFDQPNARLFIGGSTSLESAESESVISFFVVDGELSDGSIELAELVADRPIASSSVRCAIAASASDSWYSTDHTVRLTAQSAAQSVQNRGLMVDDMVQPFAPFFSGSKNSIRVLPRRVENWGAPTRAQLSRAGSIDGNYYSESITCDLDSETTPIIFDPVALLGQWPSPDASEVIARILWETIDRPLPMHPLIERREVLSVQRSY